MRTALTHCVHAPRRHYMLLLSTEKVWTSEPAGKPSPYVTVLSLDRKRVAGRVSLAAAAEKCGWRWPVGRLFGTSVVVLVGGWWLWCAFSLELVPVDHQRSLVAILKRMQV